MKLVLVLNLPYVINKNLNQVLALKNYHFVFITKEKNTRYPMSRKLSAKTNQKSIEKVILLLLFFVENRKKNASC